MHYINPISGAALAAALAQEQLAAEKNRHIRRQQSLQRNVAASADRFEHAVENAEEISPVHDEQDRRPPPRKPPDHHQADEDADGQEPPHIDVVG
jgi:hypothetical protein